MRGREVIASSTALKGLHRAPSPLESAIKMLEQIVKSKAAGGAVEQGDTAPRQPSPPTAKTGRRPAPEE